MVEILWDKKFKNCAIFWDLLQRVIVLKINVSLKSNWVAQKDLREQKRIHILILQVKSLICTYLIFLRQSKHSNNKFGTKTKPRTVEPHTKWHWSNFSFETKISAKKLSSNNMPFRYLWNITQMLQLKYSIHHKLIL